jgi:hypothetical protein
MYYSLVFLLGPAVVSQVEHTDGVRNRDETAGSPTERTVQVCESSVAVEGLSAYSEARLSGGGRIVKVLGHTKYMKELQNAPKSPWVRFAREADILVLNVGHHYRAFDRTFSGYERFVEGVELSLRGVLKPTARLVVRTTNIGHIGCQNASRPLHDRKVAWERLAERPGAIFEWSPPNNSDTVRLEPGRGNPISAKSSRRDPFDWRAPPLHEGAWSRVFRRSASFGHRFSLLNVSFVDARPDGHVAQAMRFSDESERKSMWGNGLDCLHYCFPGPADFWSLALFNLLRRTDDSGHPPSPDPSR